MTEEGERLQKVLARAGFGCSVELVQHRRGLHFDAVVDEREEQVFLVGEVRVDGALGEAGGGGDLVERGAVEAFLGEHDRGRLEEVRPGHGPAAFRGQRLHRHESTP